MPPATRQTDACRSSNHQTVCLDGRTWLRVAAFALALALLAAAGTEASAAEGAPKARKILFLGNSITRHGPAPAIGWSGDWGMAASSRDKDFVHRVAGSLAQTTGAAPELMIENIAEFERQYATYDVDAKLKQAFDFRADLVIVAIGENVPKLDSDQAQRQLADSLGRLLRGLKADNEPLIVVRSCFWPNEAKERSLRQACGAVGGVFVDIGKLAKDESNYARSEREFKHAGVAAHPGDRGMQAIAEAILAAIGDRL